MLRFRQAVLALLLSMLSFSPALAGLPQASCMARSAMCPMCSHHAMSADGASPMHCAGTQQREAHALRSHAVQVPRRVSGPELFVVSLRTPETACACVPPRALSVVEALPPYSHPDATIAPPVLEEAVWPPAPPLLTGPRSLAVLSVPLALQGNALRPLRL